MATKLPRVMVTVTEEQHAILSRMAVIQRRPVSSFVRELLDAAMPALRASLPILEARERTLAEQPQALAEAAHGLLQVLQGIDPDQLSLLVDEDDMRDLANAASPPAQREPEEGRGRSAAKASTARTSPRPRTARGARR